MIRHTSKAESLVNLFGARIANTLLLKNIGQTLGMVQRFYVLTNALRATNGVGMAVARQTQKDSVF